MQPFQLNQATPRTASFITELNASFANFRLQQRRQYPPQESLSRLDIRIQILIKDNSLLTPFVCLSTLDTMPSDVERMVLHKYAPTSVILNSKQAHEIAAEVLEHIQKKQTDLESKKNRLLEKFSSIRSSLACTTTPASSTAAPSELMPPPPAPKKPLPQNRLPSLSTSCSSSFPSPPPPPSPEQTPTHHSPIAPFASPNLEPQKLSPTPINQFFSFAATSPSTTTPPLPRTPPLTRTPPPLSHPALYSISPTRPCTPPPPASSFSPTPAHPHFSPSSSFALPACGKTPPVQPRPIPIPDPLSRPIDRLPHLPGMSSQSSPSPSPSPQPNNLMTCLGKIKHEHVRVQKLIALASSLDQKQQLNTEFKERLTRYITRLQLSRFQLRQVCAFIENLPDLVPEEQKPQK